LLVKRTGHPISKSFLAPPSLLTTKTTCWPSSTEMNWSSSEQKEWC